jgi:hypothetical protein
MRMKLDEKTKGLIAVGASITAARGEIGPEEYARMRRETREE